MTTKRIETHASVLEFDGDLVRKRKKAVRFPFVDLSTPELRRAACRNELHLNRRLAPDVYLRVEEIHSASGALIDAEVVMRRLPEERSLAARVNAGTDVMDDLTRIAQVLAAFHAGAQRSPDIARAGTPDGLRGRWHADLDEWEPLAAQVIRCPGLDRERTLVDRYIAGRADLLTGRVADGHIVDGHGDLLTTDIFCMPDGPRILDCLEFDSALRCGDALADVAFLAMDLERLGRPDLADRIVTDYRRFAGEDAPGSLLHLYVAQRAMVRSKVACLKAGQGDPDAPDDARAHYELCRRHLEAARVIVAVIGGGPGTGKSTLASRLASATGWLHLRSDELRREIGGIGQAVRNDRDALDHGLYAPELTDRTYSALMDRAAIALRGGRGVILDATFSAERFRRDTRRVADDTVSDVVEFECVAPEGTVQDRVRRREARHDDPSEADVGIARMLGDRRDPWPQAHAIDTTQPHDVQLASALARVHEIPVRPVTTA
jgi:aminoglycoside phosphotransferase family enzyme/predicted kinase